MLDVSYYYIYIANHAQDSNLAFPPLSTSFQLLLPVQSRQTASFSAPPSPRGASSANETLVSYRCLVPPAFAIEPH